MAATFTACHAVFHPGPDGWRRGKASQRTPSAQARWEASRARTAGGHLAGKRRRPQAATAGPSPGCLLIKPPTPPAAVMVLEILRRWSLCGLRVALSATSISNTFNL